MAEAVEFDAGLLKAVETRNANQKTWLAQQVSDRFGSDLSGLTFGVWGLSFKPGTDDMREAPSKVLLHALIDAGARVLAYDPVAMESARRELPEVWFREQKLSLANHQYDALQGVDALLLVTEWKPFRNPDLDAMKRLMKQRVIIDGRNQYDPPLIREAGFEYVGVGRRNV
jgi:UDPglucose 6-dehydrogenase